MHGNLLPIIVLSFSSGMSLVTYRIKRLLKLEQTLPGREVILFEYKSLIKLKSRQFNK